MPVPLTLRCANITRHPKRVATAEPPRVGLESGPGLADNRHRDLSHEGKGDSGARSARPPRRAPCRANGHGARATPADDSRGRHDRIPHPDPPLQGGRGTRRADGATFTVKPDPHRMRCPGAGARKRQRGRRIPPSTGAAGSLSRNVNLRTFPPADSADRRARAPRSWFIHFRQQILWITLCTTPGQPSETRISAGLVTD
jgi:hypothetical protein